MLRKLVSEPSEQRVGESGKWPFPAGPVLGLAMGKADKGDVQAVDGVP